MRTFLQALLILAGTVLALVGGALVLGGFAGPRHDVGAVVGPMAVLFGVSLLVLGAILGLAGLLWHAATGSKGR